MSNDERGGASGNIELAALLREAMELKRLRRSGWCRVGVAEPESVADHSWGVGLLVALTCPPTLDRGRALAMAVVHDLAELRVGDFTPHDAVSPERKHVLERAALADLLALAGARGAELLALWDEYEAQSSAEARWVRQCDKLEMGVQAAVYTSREDLDLGEFVASARGALQSDALCALHDAVHDASEWG